MWVVWLRLGAVVAVRCGGGPDTLLRGVHRLSGPSIGLARTGQKWALFGTGKC